MTHKPSSTDWAAWFLMAMAAVLACVIIGSQVGAWLGYAIGSWMH
jgi:membrane protein DedA with SNARE-associated domain